MNRLRFPAFSLAILLATGSRTSVGAFVPPGADVSDSRVDNQITKSEATLLGRDVVVEVDLPNLGSYFGHQLFTPYGYETGHWTNVGDAKRALYFQIVPGSTVHTAPVGTRAVSNLPWQQPQEVILYKYQVEYFFRIPVSSIQPGDCLAVYLRNNDPTPKYLRLNAGPFNQYHISPDLPLAKILPARPKPQFVPGFSPAASVEGSNKQPVARLNVKYLALMPTSVTGRDRIYIRSDDQLSSQSGDTATQIEFAVGHHHDGVAPTWLKGTLGSLSTNVEMRALGNQNSVRHLFDRTVPASTSISAGVHWESQLLGPHFVVRNVVSAGIAPSLTLEPYYEYRPNVDTQLNRSHTGRSVFNVGAGINWRPIYLFTHGNPNPSSDISIELAAKEWWLPGEKALAGARASHFENYYTVSVTKPLTHMIIDSITLTYSNGADPANGFRRSDSLAIQFGIFGTTTTLK